MIWISVWGVIALTWNFTTLTNLVLNKHNCEVEAIVVVSVGVNVVCFLLWCIS